MENYFKPVHSPYDYAKAKQRQHHHHNSSRSNRTEDILLGVTGGPKRAVSSSQLPSKGILKNKEPHADIRKAKSMEVLSPRLSKGQEPSGQKGRGITQTQTEQARANFVQGKVQFSAFLDEITKQVMSPSDLSILGSTTIRQLRRQWLWHNLLGRSSLSCHPRIIEEAQERSWNRIPNTTADRRNQI
ncbi:unnamed protein product [Tetraodon nigroviridis]|uniref:Chromosome 1 SCAF15008, whole genome shotgun sequence n=1 Tax=Tetraodon nigroviridis TaxID=99883 RepID=Q4RPC4_TETNG|nr:unnamed protein product [Tetraodon nigroviridis]